MPSALAEPAPDAMRENWQAAELPPPPTDAATEADTLLIARISAGDAAAFSEFYDRHASLLFGLALKMAGDRTEAEEIVQEACVAIWQRASSYNPALGRPLTWAVTVLRHKAIDRLRTTQCRVQLVHRAAELAAVAEPAVGESSGRHELITRESAAQVRAALAEMPGEQRRALELAFFRGLTQTEIAAELRQPLGTVKARIRRGLLSLRDALHERL